MIHRFSFTVFLIFALSLSQISYCDEEDLFNDDYGQKPLYKYHFATKDLMQTSATNVPVEGYHVVEGSYYPAESGLVGTHAIGGIGGVGGIGGIGGINGVGGGIGGIGGVGPIGYSGVGGIGGINGGGIGGINGGGIGGINSGGIGGINGGGIGIGGPIGYGHINPHYIGGGAGLGVGAAGIGGLGGLGGGYISPLVHGYGGEAVQKNEFSEGKKNLEDAKYEKANGEKKEEAHANKEGYHQDSQAVKDVKGEEGYYSNKAGGKNVVEDGKQYQGGQVYNQEGKNGDEHTTKTGHKKGHKIKGFKSSHHKDESGKTEEYYDEEHDEGDTHVFKGQNGAFGQKGASSYKGGHEDGKFHEQEEKKSGHVNNEHALKKENADTGKYGETKYTNSGSAYGVNNGADQQSLLGHQENARFVKHHPVPFYHHI